MIIKELIDEDFVNYKKPAMFLAFPTCTWKCEKEYGHNLCHNSHLAGKPNITVGIHDIINRYKQNNLTSAIIFGGLEPIDSLTELLYFIFEFRRLEIDDDIIIQTGYTEEELKTMPVIMFDCEAEMSIYDCLSMHKNIIVKFGRFIPNQQSHFDEILGIELASNNQYGKIISKE